MACSELGMILGLWLRRERPRREHRSEDLLLRYPVPCAMQGKKRIRTKIGHTGDTWGGGGTQLFTLSSWKEKTPNKKQRGNRSTHALKKASENSGREGGKGMKSSKERQVLHLGVKKCEGGAPAPKLSQKRKEGKHIR